MMSGNHNVERIRKFIPRAHRLSWIMLLVTTISILMNSIDRLILPTLMPAVMKEFNLSEVEAGWLNSLSFIGALLGALILGFLSDHIGGGYKRARSWLLAVAIEIAAGVASAYAFSYKSFMALRLAMGFGSGGAEPLNVSLIGEWWQKENRGFAIGVHHTGFPLGQFVGPLLIGLVLAATGSWRDVFLFIPLLGVPIVILQMVLSTKKNHDTVMDWIDRNGLTQPEVDDIQKKSLKETVKEGLQCLQHPNCRIAIILFFCFIWAEMGIATFLTVHLTREVGLSLTDAAIISGASGITGWLGQIFWGSFSDYKGRKLCLLIIMAGWIVSAVLCGFITSVATGWLILIFWGLFRNSPFPVIYAVLIDAVPKNSGAGMGLMIGLAFGSAGFLVSPFAGWVIAGYGFTVHYALITAILILACIPLLKLRDIG